MWIRDGKFGSEIRDGTRSDLGSGINIPDPQLCIKPCCFRDKKFRWSEVDTSQLESTQPVNFSPSHRPRRQDFKVRVILCKVIHRHCFGFGSRLLLKLDPIRNPIKIFLLQSSFCMSSLTPAKGVQGPGEASSPTKGFSVKFLYVFLFWGTIVACLDPDSQSGSNGPI